MVRRRCGDTGRDDESRRRPPLMLTRQLSYAVRKDRSTMPTLAGVRYAQSDDDRNGGDDRIDTDNMPGMVRGVCSVRTPSGSHNWAAKPLYCPEAQR